MSSYLIRIAIAAPAAALRAGLRTLLSVDADLQVVAEAVEIQDIAFSVDQMDVLIVQTDESVLEFLQSQPDAASYPAVLFLNSAHIQDVSTITELGLLNWGMLELESSPQELRAAVRAIDAGLCVFAPQCAVKLWVNKKPAPMQNPYALDHLTPREIQVLQLLAEGLPNKQIASALQISEHTVKYHISSIYSKLGATNRTEAVRSGIRSGWITF